MYPKALKKMIICFIKLTSMVLVHGNQLPRMCPLRPYLVRSSTGLNQSISSRLKNMKRTTALLRCTLKAWPLRTALLTTIRSGLTEWTDPVATSTVLPSFFSRNTKTDDGGKTIGANIVATTTDSGRKNRSAFS